MNHPFKEKATKLNGIESGGTSTIFDFVSVRTPSSDAESGLTLSLDL
jgi:hypothetical protein